MLREGTLKFEFYVAFFSKVSYNVHHIWLKNADPNLTRGDDMDRRKQNSLAFSVSLQS